MKTLSYLIFFVILYLSGVACSASTERTQQSTLPDGSVEITLSHLSDSPERSSYEIGEHIFYRLRIENHTQVPIEPNLIICNYLLAFDRSIRMHLIAPGGQDLLLPYQQEDIEISEPWCPPAHIAPQEAWGRSIYFSRWLDLRQTGQYLLWVELEHLGQSYRSNEITFEIVDVPATLSPESINLTIGNDTPIYTVENLLNSQLVFEVTFTNNAHQTLIFLKPQGGSFERQINPGYDFTVIDDTGRSLSRHLPEPPGKPVYSEDTKFRLEPGDEYRMQIHLRGFPEMQQPGEYRVRLTYIVHESAFDQWGIFLLDEPMNWEEGVFTGVLESNEITITITE